MWKRSIGSVLATVATAAILGGCFAEDGPTRTELPPTDELSTEQSTTTTTTTPSTTANRSQGFTVATAISTAPRVNNSMYHQAAQTQGGRIEDTSQFHFVTVDGAVNCSTVQRDRPTLACEPTDPAGSASSTTRDYCNWEPNYVVLTDTPSQGTCADTPWVWVRGSQLPTGSTISVGVFQCLSAESGLYCLNTRSLNGFALRNGEYRALSGADPAPAALTEGSEETTATSGR
jgi:hypothetical protein